MEGVEEREGVWCEPLEAEEVENLGSGVESEDFVGKVCTQKQIGTYWRYALARPRRWNPSERPRSTCQLRSAYSPLRPDTPNSSC
jgi:hypothetical protein